MAKGAVDDMFATPSAVLSGEYVNLADLEGCLVVMRAKSPEEHTEQTEYGEGTYVESEVLVVEGAEELSGDWRELYVWAVAVRNQLKNAYPKPVAGIVGKGQAAKGKSAPWLIQDPDADQTKLARDTFVKAEAGF